MNNLLDDYEDEDEEFEAAPGAKVLALNFLADVHQEMGDFQGSSIGEKQGKDFSNDPTALKVEGMRRQCLSLIQQHHIGDNAVSREVGLIY